MHSLVLFFICALAVAQSDIFNVTVAHQLELAPSLLAYMRIDPIVSHGVNTPSGHLHGFIGSNGITSNAQRAQLLQGQCTSLGLGGNLDMSAYWFPVMYHVAANGQKTLLQAKSGSVYYDLYSANGSVEPFPDDFQMITGNASALDGNCANGHGAGNGYFYGDFGDAYTLPTQWTSSLGLHIAFPDCWTGNPFTKATQAQEMAYSNFNAGSICPAGFQRIPRITLSVSNEEAPCLKHT
jgi:hypothetical protein